ncbi:MAG TPA: 30S ribosome-binding factor RbfA [Actinomycetota bacterium]|nr:30S ribosome-binding factor RbfA [Actinomycetota bacterium]
MTRRTQRVGETMREVISELIQRSVKDPRIGFVTITAVRVTPDLSKAHVYYSVLDPEERDDTQRGLESAAPFLRSESGRQLRLKTIPQLLFHLDDAADQGARVDRLLDEIHLAENRDGESPGSPSA